jgi:copper(I)-binding protein
MNRRPFAAFTLALLLSGAAAGALAHEYQAGSLKIAHPWSRITVPGQQAGGAFFSVQNTGAADRLLGASSPAAERVELHTMAMDANNVMKMREVPAVDLPAGANVDLQPSGAFHLMLMGLKAPLKLGDKVPLTLRFEKAGEVKVDLKVEAATPSPVRPPMESASGGHQH